MQAGARDETRAPFRGGLRTSPGPDWTWSSHPVQEMNLGAGMRGVITALRARVYPRIAFWVGFRPLGGRHTKREARKGTSRDAWAYAHAVYPKMFGYRFPG